MMNLIALFQNSIVEDKLKDAPDNGYAIGVFIGYMLPLLVLVAFAYLLYTYFKRKNQN